MPGLIKTRQYARCSVHRILIVEGKLIAEPQRDPRAVRPLRTFQKSKRAMNGASRNVPFVPCEQGVRRDVGRAAIEWELAPAPAERGHAAIAILKIEQPRDAGRCR